MCWNMYIANYDNYSGEKTRAGGTALNSQKNGDHIKPRIKIEKESIIYPYNGLTNQENNETTFNK